MHNHQCDFNPAPLLLLVLLVLLCRHDCRRQVSLLLGSLHIFLF
jgi:hypothetical protein